MHTVLFDLIKVIPLGGAHQGKSVLMASHLSPGKGREMWPQSKICNVVTSCLPQDVPTHL